MLLYLSNSVRSKKCTFVALFQYAISKISKIISLQKILHGKRKYGAQNRAFD